MWDLDYERVSQGKGSKCGCDLGWVLEGKCFRD